MAYNLIKNRKGISTIPLIFFIVFIFISTIVLGVMYFATDTVNSLFTQIDFELGEQNFTEVYEATTGQGINAVLRILDILGKSLILGMVMVMLFIGYFSTNNRLWIVLDLFIVVATFIAAVYLQQLFNTYINSADILLDVYSTGMQDTSTLMLNLPFMIPIVGILMMIVTYGITKKREEEVFR